MGVLLVRNAYLFSTPLYEDADMGANSILIEQARHFSLLVGNYSRLKFNHPGPAFLYVQSWGESLFWAGLHAVPTPWNGQLIAVYALNALFAAFVVVIVYGWTRSVRGAAAALAAMLLLGALHPPVFSSDWMPYVYVPAFLAFLVAITSVAAGHTRDLWIAAIAGWFCVHGHACFMLFVPVLTGCAILALAWPRRRRLGGALTSFFTTRQRDWVPAVVISALFLVPILVELGLHWPGNFGKYFGYGSSQKAGAHGLGQDIEYVLWFWWPHHHAWAAVLLLYVAAAAAAWWCPRGPVRRFCWSLIAFDTIAMVLMFAYAAIGVDEINEYYIEYFAWSAPIVMILAIAVAVVAAVPPTRALAGAATATVAAAAVAAGAVFATAPLTRTSIDHTDPGPASQGIGANTDPGLPAGVALLARRAGGRPVVLRFDRQAWPEMTGVLVEAERMGVPVCVADPKWEFMVTSQFICSPRELAHGAPFWMFLPGKVPQGVPVVFRFKRATVTAHPGPPSLRLHRSEVRATDDGRRLFGECLTAASPCAARRW
jgi:hypothetical protein